MAYTEAQLIAGAIAIDRDALRLQGWSQREIDIAIATVEQPSKYGLETARIVLDAADAAQSS